MRPSGKPQLVAATLVVALAAPVAATALEVRVDDGRQRLADAVVTLEGGSGPQEQRAPATHVIDQKDETFVPYLTLLRRGDSVLFRNSDYTRHHVYTFSPVHPFEFVVPSGSQSQAVTFDRTGAAAIGCNIHDRMIAYVYVTDAPFAALTGDDGTVAFAQVPPGRWLLRAWHPRLRAGGKAFEQEVDVSAADAQPIAVTLRVERPPPAVGRERSDY